MKNKRFLSLLAVMASIMALSISACGTTAEVAQTESEKISTEAASEVETEIIEETETVEETEVVVDTENAEDLEYVEDTEYVEDIEYVEAAEDEEEPEYLSDEYDERMAELYKCNIEDGKDYTITKGNMKVSIVPAEEIEDASGDKCIVLYLTKSNGEVEEYVLFDGSFPNEFGPVVDYTFFKQNGITYFAYSVTCGTNTEGLIIGVCHVKKEKLVWDVLLVDPGYTDLVGLYDCSEVGSTRKYYDGIELGAPISVEDYREAVISRMSKFKVELIESEGDYKYIPHEYVKYPFFRIGNSAIK